MKNFDYIKDKSITVTKYWRSADHKVTKNSSSIKKLGKRIIRKLFPKKKKSRPEQKNYSSDSRVLKIRNERLSKFLCAYFSRYGLNLDPRVLLSHIEKHEKIFRSKKISSLMDGMGFNNGLILFCLASFLQPKRLIESGVWRGYTTLLLDEATYDESKIYCFDINLDHNEFISKKATYFECDISSVKDVKIDNIDFAFFDDHVSHYDRLLYCVLNNIDAVILDDDVGITQVHSDGWPPVPTAAMIYDYAEIPHKFNWIKNGFIAEADISNLDVVKIVDNYDYIPFPSLAEITGYRDSSFTSLLLKKGLNQKR